MKNYLELLSDILENGEKKGDRTGTGTISLFGKQLSFNLQEGFPLVTTKKVYMKGIVHELLWFLQGNSNIRYLTDNNIHIWDGWADENGELGPVYGVQWINWLCHNGQTVNQIREIADTLKTNPDSRRMIVSAWNVAFLPDEKISPQENVKNGKQALPPCHVMFQFYSGKMTKKDKENYLKQEYPEVFKDYNDIITDIHNNEEPLLKNNNIRIPERKLSCKLYQRSADIFLGVPFNIASYSLLTFMMAQISDMWVGDFIISFGDTHIYNNLIEQVKTQLTREPLALPKIKLNKNVKDIFDFKYEDIELVGYESHPAIKGQVSV